MQLSNLLQGVSYQLIQGDTAQEVDMIIYDSRIKTNKGLFIAIQGFDQDGHRFIPSAIENGAKVVVVQKDVQVEDDSVTVILVEDTRKVMALLANNMFNTPSKDLNLVGVTGTNGKTSTTYLLGQILEAYNKKIGIIGTIENRIGNTVLKAERTTPEASDLQKLFAKMKEEEVTHAIMEVSSHALDLHRVNGCTFKVGIFTNLTQDHLDFHHTMENYAQAKSKLFDMCETSIINKDNAYSTIMEASVKNNKITYGIDTQADYMAKDIKNTAEGIRYTLLTPEGEYPISLPIPGRFTVYNSMGVIAAARVLGIPMTFIIETLKTCKGVPGRIQSIKSKKGYSVVVDYAHTPDGLENVLQAVSEYTKGRVITVFGCGGDRDNTKRPLMGEAVAKNSDEVIITSDNPRSEDPLRILDQVEVGVEKYTQNYVKIEDRKQAIIEAMRRAKAGDVVVVAGKGHENYQILRDRIIHFDDGEIVRAFMEEE